MFSAEVRRKASAAEEGGLVMEPWKAETGRSQEKASSSASDPTPPPMTQLTPMSPGTHAPSAFGFPNHLPPPFDLTGQVAPSVMKPRVTLSLWEDEGCCCFQVDARGVLVARREDNDMVNGTKLLKVAGVTPDRRYSMLKSEKSRHVVRIAPIHLKGIWIPFERALEFANKEKITELLYPLFVHDIAPLLYQPSHQWTSPRPDSQRRTQEVKKWAERNDNHVRQIDVPENSGKSLRRFPLNTVRNHEFHEQGPIGSLYKSLIELLGLILIDVRMQSDMAQHYGYLESSCAALFFWGTDLGLSRGELDDMLQDSPQLRDTCLTVLVSISQFASTSLIYLISSEHRQKEVLQSTGISTSLEQTMNMIEQQHHSTYRPEQGVETLCQTLRTKIDTLIMLTPSLASPAEESFDDEEPRDIQDIEEHLPEQAYANSVSQKFPLAASAIVACLGKLNWDRYNNMLRLQRESLQQEFQTTALEKARTIFHDSGLGVSLPAQSEVGLNIYAPSMVSSRAEASHKRAPPLPAHARAGEPFTCEICNKQVQFQRTTAWKKHIFDDILAYACFFAECCDTRVFFENSEALMTHLQDHHGMDVRVSDVTCPLCVEFTSGDRDVLSLHIARHMEEIALAILPSGVDSDEESADNSISDATSTKDEDVSQTRHNEHREVLTLKEKVLGKEHPNTLMSINNVAIALSNQGKYGQAEQMLRATLALEENGLESEHPHTLTIMGNLASVLVRQGKYEAAEAMKRHMLALKEKVLGPEHPDTLTSIGNLAGVLDRQGQYEEATTQNPAPHPFSPVSQPGDMQHDAAFAGNNSQSASASTTAAEPASPMGPPGRPPKRKAVFLLPEDWEPYKERIRDLYVNQNKHVQEVIETIDQEYGFKATLRQYEFRMYQWGLKRKVSLQKASDRAKASEEEAHRHP